MAITPKDAAARNDKRHKEQLEKAEEEVDAILKRGFASGYSVHMDSNQFPFQNDYWLRQELLRRYRSAGWSIESWDSQKEGTSGLIFERREGHD